MSNHNFILRDQGQNTFSLEKRIREAGYAFLLLYALASHVSTAVASIAIGGGVLAILALLLLHRGRVSLTDHQVTLSKYFFLFCLSVGVTSLFSYDPVASLSGTMGMAARLIPMFMAIFFLDSKKQVQWVIVAMLVSVVIADFVAIRQIINHEQAIGLVHNRIYFANQLLPMLILTVACLFYKGYSSLGIRCFIVFAALLTAGVLVFSQVRGVWVAALATYLLFLFIYREQGKKLIVLSFFIALLTSLCFWLNPDLLARLKSISDMTSMSNIERIYMWQSAWLMFVENPLWGLGFGQFGHFYTPEYHYLMPMSTHPGYAHPHNVFMTFLAETGFIGSMTFISFFAAILFMTLKRHRKAHDALSIVAFLSTAGFLFAGITDNVFAMITVLRIISLLIGMGFSHVMLELK